VVTKWIYRLSPLALLVIVGTSCSAPSNPHAGNHLHVVAAESPWGSVAQAIGGDAVQVTSVLSDPGIDPHSYVPSAVVAGEVAEADVVIENGLGYDSFMDRLLGTGAAHGRISLTVASVLGVSGSDANPHLWYWLQRVPKVAAAIATSFEHADPARTSKYQRNLAAFLVSMQPLLSTTASIAATSGGEEVAQTERVAGYLLEESGLHVVSPASFASAIEDGRDPSAGDSATMDQLMRSSRVRALVVNTATESKVTSRLQTEAMRAGIGIVQMSELVTPVHATYVEWQSAQLAQLQSGLRQGSSR